YDVTIDAQIGQHGRLRTIRFRHQCEGQVLRTNLTMTKAIGLRHRVLQQAFNGLAEGKIGIDGKGFFDGRSEAEPSEYLGPAGRYASCVTEDHTRTGILKETPAVALARRHSFLADNGLRPIPEALWMTTIGGLKPGIN